MLALLAACPSPNRNVDTSSKPSSGDDAGPLGASEAAIIGTYQCRWLHGERGLDLPCEIRKQATGNILTMIVGKASFSGVVTTTDFGFQFAGRYTPSQGAAAENLAADFFHQGPGAYASVFTLADKSLVKLDLHRK